MKKLFLLGVLIAGFAFSLAGQVNLNPEAKLPLDPNVRTGKLTNGMTYFIRKNGKPENRAELRLAVNAGSMEENDDQQGLAHFCEHMAFNGTKNFKKNELVDYLESIGTKFGAHLNAYTSFDETVYMLQLPTDKEEVLMKGLQILEDWAHNVSFDNAEIDKERGVVMEEWRLGQGANERMRNKYWPVIFKDSRYALRLPIGKPEIIKGCKYETLKQFYNDWYRPELMAVIAVGDFDPDKMEKIIKEKFSAIKPKPNSKKLQEYPVPDNKEILIGKATDKEATASVIQVMYKHPVEKMLTVNDYRKDLIIDLYTGMLNARYDEIRQQPNTPFAFAGCYYGSSVRTKDNYSTYAYASSDKNIDKALETVVEENERVKRYGFTATELERHKKTMLRQFETSFNEKDKTESGDYISQYVYYFLEGEPAPGIEFEYELVKKFIGEIKLEEVNGLSKKFITNGENCVVVITAPDKPGVELPSDEKIKSVFSTIQKSDIKPYVDNVIDKPLISKEPVPGKVIEEKQVKEFGITEWVLSNGLKVVLKSTDFKNDEILFSAHSFGGSGLYPDKDALSAGYSGYIIDQSGLGEFDNVSLEKALSGKIFEVFPYIGDLAEGMQGSASPQDLESLLQLIHLYFTAPRKDASAFEAVMQQQIGFLQNRSASPESAWQDTMQVTMAQYHPRAKPMSMERLKEIELDKAFTIFKERFSSGGDFTFFFVGNFEMDKMKSLVEKYLGSLPSGKKETWKDLGINSPKGVIQKTVKRGSEPKSMVNFRFTGDFDYNSQNRISLLALLKLVNIKLREILREEKGGTYGVSAYPYIEKLPKPRYDLSISFGCAPDKLDELTKATLEQLEKLKTDGCNEKDLQKIKETLKREREVQLKENRFWLSVISQGYVNGEPILPPADFNKYVDGLKGEDFKKLAAQYFNMNNFATFKLVPEK